MKKGNRRKKSKRGVFSPPPDPPGFHPDSDLESEAEDEEYDCSRGKEARSKQRIERKSEKSTASLEEKSKRAHRLPAHLNEYHIPKQAVHRLSSSDLRNIPPSSSQGTPERKEVISGDWAHPNESRSSQSPEGENNVNWIPPRCEYSGDDESEDDDEPPPPLGLDSEEEESDNEDSDEDWIEEEEGEEQETTDDRMPHMTRKVTVVLEDIRNVEGYAAVVNDTDGTNATVVLAQKISDNTGCAICHFRFKRRENVISCKTCTTTFHQRCLKMSSQSYKNAISSNEGWLCNSCNPNYVPPQPNRAVNGIKWGSLSNIEDIKTEIESIHSKIVSWNKNIFAVPRGKAGKEFISECTHLVRLFNSRNKWEPVALNMLMIFTPLMLQKPSKKSKPKDHRRYLLKRLDWWKNGSIKELVSECEEIQKRMALSFIKTAKKEKIVKEQSRKRFTQLMLEGKVKDALKYVDSDSCISGVHTITPEIIDVLQSKHPEPEPINPDVLNYGEPPHVEDVIFEAIDSTVIQKAAKDIHGSGGPTKIDADILKHVLCSKIFGKESDQFAEEIAIATRRLCIEDVPHDYVNLLLDNRMIPLIKDETGTRPIGVGEVLRRIMCKSVARVLRNDIQIAGGVLQTCTGVEAGIEAAVHAMNSLFEKEECEAVLLVDAENAFNRLNRKTALENVKHKCPPLFRFLNNTYKEPARLHLGNGQFILSQEGVTQGDPLAMALYAIATRHFIDLIKQNTDSLQVWFADDSLLGGKLVHIKDSFDYINAIGPKDGYNPKASKTYLIVKTMTMKEKAEEMFKDTGVNIVLGHRYLGGFIGNVESKEIYVQEKVTKWVEDVTEIAEIAKDEPQVALSAFNIGLSQRWTFIQRTVKDISALFHPLEDAIRHKFIPALLGGKVVNDVERKLLALPYRYGGLGIRNPVKTADSANRSSVKITELLSNLIISQQTDLSLLDQDIVKEVKQEVIAEKEKAFKKEEAEVLCHFDTKTQKLIKAAQEKGASSWLSALPLKKLGYAINKEEFRDAVSLRYGWDISDMPRFCACGKDNSVDHALICGLGGYTIMRHNSLRDTEAKILKEVCNDVKTEPRLIPTNAELLYGNAADEARLDISARGLWSGGEKTMFDVKVTHPTAPSYLNKSMDAIYRDSEYSKKYDYQQRVLNVEKCSFTPLVFSTTGGMAPDCTRTNKRIATLISVKTGESYSHVVSHLRTRLRFALLRACLVAIRGFRGKEFKTDEETQLNEISFSLIPRASVE